MQVSTSSCVNKVLRGLLLCISLPSAVAHEHHEHRENHRHMPKLCGIFGVLLLLHVFLIFATIKVLKIFRPNLQSNNRESNYHLVGRENFVPEDKESEEKIKEQRTFLLNFSNSVVYLGIANFIPVPCFFMILHLGVNCIWAMIGIAVKALLGTWAQRKMVDKLKDFVDTTNPAIINLKQRDSCLPVPKWFLVYLFAIGDYADLDFDAANAGQASFFPPQVLQTYSFMWDRVPFIGHTLCELGLSGTLTLILVVASLVQLGAFLKKIWELKHFKVPKWAGKFSPPNADPSNAKQASEFRESRIAVWFDLQHACDASSLTLLADVCNVLLQFEMEEDAQHLQSINEDRYRHAGRAIRFEVRNLVEACPNLWFSVSLIALSYHSDTEEEKLLMILSIISSIFTIVKANHNEFQDIVESVRVGKEWRGYEGKIRLGAAFRLNYLLLSLYVLSASIVRLGGVWYCDSHLLSLMSGCYNPPASEKTHPE